MCFGGRRCLRESVTSTVMNNGVGMVRMEVRWTTVSYIYPSCRLGFELTENGKEYGGFQQDGAICHTSNSNMTRISEVFPENRLVKKPMTFTIAGLNSLLFLFMRNSEMQSTCPLLKIDDRFKILELWAFRFIRYLSGSVKFKPRLLTCQLRIHECHPDYPSDLDNRPYTGWKGTDALKFKM
ncbi:hypothetical protein ANN_10089 [Periplaneta americana]|uniref:Uncharacterized protein n=1 Tax=Periplaneta americana TaxID=6978 RepID=A0ABQ8TND4_PERAM|nr:hypothetical protein ANN_10089 [Periplaneta americana]